MFVGHYSVAFAAKTERNGIPLWVLFIAVQFLDYIWATLILLGIEKLRVIKGFTAGSMLDSYFQVYSHSLIMAILWSVLAAVGYRPLCKWLGYAYNKSAAFIIGIAVFSHWILDLIAHPRDLPIYDNPRKLVLVCGTIASWSSRWKSLSLPAGSFCTLREMRCRQFAK